MGVGMDFDWYLSEAADAFRLVYRKLTGRRAQSKRYAGRRVLTTDEAGRLLREWIASGRPFMASRYGSVALETAAAVYRNENGKAGALDRVIRKGDIFRNAGFFPEEREQIRDFGGLMMECGKKADMLGVWYIPGEEYFAGHFAKDAALAPLRSYEPWNASEPWTSALAGKKVLVIHPFSETIESQYSRREKLFARDDMLPQFELKTVTAVQTIAGNRDERFGNWFEALEYMYNQAMAQEFDIAILGCGAYGMPLAAMLKDAGKQAIHIGGAAQLLFGIRGKRWDDHPVVSGLYNPFWVRPAQSERPAGLDQVENGCYW